MKIPAGKVVPGMQIEGINLTTGKETLYTVTAVRQTGNYYWVKATAPGVPEREYKYHKMNNVNIRG